MSAPKRYTEEVKAEAVRRYMAGESSPKIAADIGCTASSIMDWVNRALSTILKGVKIKWKTPQKKRPPLLAQRRTYIKTI